MSLVTIAHIFICVAGVVVIYAGIIHSGKVAT